MSLENQIVILKEIIQETIWMARRYANNRRSYATSTVNEYIDIALKLGVNIKPDLVDGIGMYANDADLGRWDPAEQAFFKPNPQKEDV